MMGYTFIPMITFLVLGAMMLSAPTSSRKLKPPQVAPHCLDIAREKRALEPCFGPSCRICNGLCKPQCGPNESSLGTGYCGRGCQCCQPALPPCLLGTSCGSGGKCRRGNTCPKGEKPISGRCGFSKSCICCAPDQGTCPAPFKQHGSEYFYFHDSSKMNWDQALSHCKSLGGSLAEPANMDDFIAHIASSYSHMKYDIWLGATDRSVEQDWKWLSGGSVPASLWPAWPGNQPSGDGDCMQIHYHGYSGFFLNDYYCRVKGYFVCECTPNVTTDCQGKCTVTNRGSGYCKETCAIGEERLGSCPGGNCSCCRRRVTPVCSGICTPKEGQWGYCSTSCFQNPINHKSETEFPLSSLVPVPQYCTRGCSCCPLGILPVQ